MRTPTSIFRRVFAGLLLCVLALGCVASAAATALDSENSEASVSFVDGTLEFGTLTGSKLNFDFGSHQLPMAAVSYPAENTDGDHSLQVVDSRYVSGDWSVSATLTSFSTSAAPNYQFDAIIQMVEPVVTSANTLTDKSELAVTDPFKATSGSTVKLMDASADLTRDAYTATWTNAKVTLDIADAIIPDVGPGAYTATLTWDLNVGP